MANRDEAKALKDRKPIDYHMFLSGKFKNNTIFQYNDHIDTKFTANKKQSVVQKLAGKDYKENRVCKRIIDSKILARLKCETRSSCLIVKVEEEQSNFLGVFHNNSVMEFRFMTVSDTMQISRFIVRYSFSIVYSYLFHYLEIV